MFGGYYVMMARDTGTAKAVSLVAGPFKTFADASAIGPAAMKLATTKNPEYVKDEWNVGFFQWPRLIAGQLNGDLWVKPYAEDWSKPAPTFSGPGSPDPWLSPASKPQPRRA